MADAEEGQTGEVGLGRQYFSVGNGILKFRVPHMASSSFIHQVAHNQDTPMLLNGDQTNHFF